MNKNYIIFFKKTNIKTIKKQGNKKRNITKTNNKDFEILDLSSCK